MNYYDKRIASYLTVEESLMQLAEEAAELSQAALKLIRARGGNNPAPVTGGQAMDNLTEECADVTLCLRVVSAKIGFDWDRATDIQEAKAARWIGRLEEKHGRGWPHSEQFFAVQQGFDSKFPQSWDTDKEKNDG